MIRISSLTAFIICMLTSDVFACSMCADMGTIEKHIPCNACKASGKVFPPQVPCQACNGQGYKTSSAYRGTTGTYSHSRVKCRTCRGTGMYQPPKVPCPACNGQGKFVKRILCPRCKGASAVGKMNTEVPLQSGETSVNMVSIEKCTKCDANGNIVDKIVCEICNHGWNHKKTDSGAYECRSCGATCKTRFDACRCGKPDCPQCKGVFEKTVTRGCPFCGGDKIITPLEREKAESGAQKK